MQRKYWKGLLIAMAILALACTTTLTGCKKKVASDAGLKTSGTSTGTDTGSASTGMSDEELARQRAAEEALREAEAAAARFNSEMINFAFDSSELSPEAMATLKDKANYLQQNPEKGVLIKGHCDERGSLEYNLALGDRRANSAKNFLTDLGIEARRINTVSYGEEMPLDPAQNEAAWAANRRAEFALE